MFGISYFTWKTVCEMYFNLKHGSKKAYLQWYPLSKLSTRDETYLKSEDFFNKYIKSGAFVMFPTIMHQTENFLQKSDGSFRDASLISPVLYLILQAIGKEVAKKYICQRPDEISIYYAGNYEYMRPSYKQEYDAFFKEININTENFNYFIKTDITNFYHSINLDKLIKHIDSICNQDSTQISQLELVLYKRLFAYCGEGKFPLIENSVASSYLSTVIYLESVDMKLYDFIKKTQAFNNFKMIRYVDDLYILISTDDEIADLQKPYTEIRNEYSSILKEYNMMLNSTKCCIRSIDEINAELKKSLYDELYNQKKFIISNLYENHVLEFLQDLETTSFLEYVTNEKYNNIIEKHFSIEGIQFTAHEVFNYYVYEKNEIFKKQEAISAIEGLIDNDISIISLDPKRLTVMLLSTKDERTIKSFLSQLFARYRAEKWNSYDSTIAINYLLQRNFRHEDLLLVLECNCPELYFYYYNFCKENFCDILMKTYDNSLCTIIKDDQKTYYLYFMYLTEIQKNNMMEGFAYFKNYFDRCTALFAYHLNGRQGRFSIEGYYKEKVLKPFYQTIENSDIIIAQAHKLRNANPVSHASAKLLDDDSTSGELLEVIDNLKRIMKMYYELNLRSCK